MNGKDDGMNYWLLGDIWLRVAEQGDAPLFFEHFRTSPEWIERAFDKVGFPPALADAERWLSGHGGDSRVFAIEGALCGAQGVSQGVSQGGELLGYIDVWEADARSGVFRTGIKMLDGKAGKGHATRAFSRVLRYYFDELRYQKCGVYIYEFNTASLRFHEKLGFVREGFLRREYYTEGRYYGAVWLGLTAEDFRAKRAS